MRRKKEKPFTPVDAEIAEHRTRERMMDYQAGRIDSSRRAKIKGREYTPAPMPTNAEIDAVLARIRKRPT